VGNNQNQRRSDRCGRLAAVDRSSKQRNEKNYNGKKKKGIDWKSYSSKEKLEKKSDKRP